MHYDKELTDIYSNSLDKLLQEDQGLQVHTLKLSTKHLCWLEMSHFSRGSSQGFGALLMGMLTVIEFPIDVGLYLESVLTNTKCNGHAVGMYLDYDTFFCFGLVLQNIGLEN